MPIDYETVRRNNPAPPPGSDWSERERLAVEAMRADMAKQREQEQHERAKEDYAAFAKSKAAAARKRGQRGDDRVARVWDAAAANIAGGKWTVDPTVNTEPAVTRFQPLRTQLAYAGAMVRFTEK